jgi:hypothetical protein
VLELTTINSVGFLPIGSMRFSHCKFVCPFLENTGLVRFKTPKSVDRAMRKFLIEEIVVQDVAVQVKVLTPTKGADAAFRQVATRPPVTAAS